MKKIENEVHKYYWHDDINCATTTLKVLASHFSVILSEQVIDSALGMHGAGKYGAQCGLVEGTLLFIGIFGRIKKLDDQKIVKTCYGYANEFEKIFSSLLCNEIRPEGFNKNVGEHICEDITVNAIKFSIEFISKNILEIIEEK